jgi:4-hydroxy-tetrahydrodipicolinate synthase
MSAMFGRVGTAMASPFLADGSLDTDGAQRLARHLADHGTDMVVVHGTTGESPTMRDEEMWELLTAVIEAVGDRAHVMMGTGSNDTGKALWSTRRATELGADSVLVVVPYYNRPTQRGLLAHFRAVAAETDLPVMLYDVPPRTARELDLDTIVELARVPNIAGLKDAAGDVAKTAEVVARTRGVDGGFDVWSGEDALNLPILAVGGVGVVSVAAHLAGTQIAEMIACFDTDPARARDIHASLMPLHRALFVEASPGPLKGALNRLGLPAGPVRAPLVDALDTTVDAVLAAMDHAGIPRPQTA